MMRIVGIEVPLDSLAKIEVNQCLLVKLRVVQPIDTVARQIWQ